MPTNRALAWDALLNVRDLGGLPTAGGGETRFGAVVRSDNLAGLTASGRDALLAFGVRTVVDLRLPFELKTEPDPFAAPDGHAIAYRNISFIDPASDRPSDRMTLADDYTGMLRRFRRQVSAVMSTIAKADDGAVLVHCAAGKDRTGLVCALLLALAGVPAAAIAEDYALTAEALRQREEWWVAQAPDDRSEREAAVEWGRARPEVMLEVLARIDATYGSAEAYLRWTRVPDEDLRRLRARLVGPPS
jgi:protein-tyrosine phosphatase